LSVKKYQLLSRSSDVNRFDFLPALDDTIDAKEVKHFESIDQDSHEIGFLESIDKLSIQINIYDSYFSRKYLSLSL